MNLTLNEKESEKDTERYLIKKVKEVGGKCFKFNSVNMRGVPDRLCFLPHGIVALVEIKSEGKDLTPLQELCFSELNKLGHYIAVVDTKKDVDTFIGEFNERIRNLKEAE